jgi:hypothetical protein
MSLNVIVQLGRIDIVFLLHKAMIESCIGSSTIILQKCGNKYFLTCFRPDEHVSDVMEFSYELAAYSAFRHKLRYHSYIHRKAERNALKAA